VTRLTILRFKFDTEINNSSTEIKEQKMKSLVLTLVLTAAVSLSALSAQPVDQPSKRKNYSNLGTAIKSENTGLKKSGIYLAGKYEISELTGTLVDQLKVEEDASIRVLIALSLYRIGDEDGFNAIDYLSKNDKNYEVRRMSSAIMEQLEMEKNTFVNR
jgi:HEAT repeat protein